MTGLEALLAEHRNKVFAIAVYDFETGEQLLVNADEPFHPASTIKVHVMIEVFHQAAQGRFALDERLLIANSFASIVDGSRFSLQESDDSERTLYARIGEMETIAELMRLMIVRSSNLATNLLLERIGIENVNGIIRALGIQGVSVIRGIEDNAAFRLGLNNSATARGLTHTMKLIAAGQAVSNQASEEMITILLGQEFNESIPARLPKPVRVAHKTGWTGNVYHDTGIVYSEDRKPYVLSIMTRGFAEDQDSAAHACMAKISQMIYEDLR